MEIFRAYKTELDPNNKQRTAMIQHAGAARWAWNWGLARRIQEYEEIGRSSNAIEQHRQLTALKRTPEYAWCYSVSKCCFQMALRDLDRAYANFFRRVKAGKKPGFPKFKSKKRGVGSFRLTGAIHIEDSRIKLPRLGWIRLKEHGYLPIKEVHVLFVTVSEKAGHWFASVQCRQEIDVNPATGEPVGIDLGIKKMAACSDGQQFENPKPLRKAQRQLTRVEREMSRRKKGGRNREKSRQKIAKLYCHIANIRKDALHKATSTICATTKPDSERPAIVAIENLNVAGMLKNHCLARAIADVGMGEFRRQIEYKTLWNGEELFVADRFFPSSRLCPSCGCINSELKLSDRIWTCDCGAVHDRDLNAACNLRDLAIKTTLSSRESNAHRDEVRPVAISRAASEKWEPSTNPHLRI